MEQCILNLKNKIESITVAKGKYYQKIQKKHISTYGEFGAKNIHDNILYTFNESLKQLNNSKKNNNMLLVGKVQSGKTSNLELFTALAFDNGFNLVIIYGGYDNTLLNQTTNRFKKTFDISNDTDYSDDTPVIFSSDDSDKLLTIDDEIIEDLLEANKPIFLISMKRPAAMNKINDLLSRIDKSNLRGFIIDDEGDQASLNTKKDKVYDASATYASIVSMKDHLNDPLYLSVTATPQALIFLDKFSRLRPDSIRLIDPGSGYCGADEYHLYDSGKIEIISNEDQQDLSDGILTESLKNAIRHYMIASSIMFKRGKKSSEMIIHSHRNISNHSTIYKMVNVFIQSFKDQVEYDDTEGLKITKKEFLLAYSNFFDQNIHCSYDFESLWDIICNKIIRRVYIILKNSIGQVTQANENLRKYKIYIGGDLLQRGVTFPGLVTTYFSRWAKDSGNMDTNLQRARWFGYREKWIDLCKIFTSDIIAREFTNLSEIETDLWEQFYCIQSGEMHIDDILIHSDDTKQKPTRRNVASYTNVVFKSKWIKQRVGLFDKNEITINNTLVDELLQNVNLHPTSAGRIDNKTSAHYSVVRRETLSNLIKHMETIFDLDPFERRPLIDLIESSDNIPVILMNDINGAGRKRSFYPNNKIYALQQGADSKDQYKMNFLGDSHIIVDPNQINIQIHKIIPMKKNVSGNVDILTDYAQYMFAIYIPKEKKYYVKG